MFWLWIVCGILFMLAVLYLVSLRCRGSHPEMEELTRYRYAHRGLHDKTAQIPENSLAAFRRAAEGGYGAELDVHLMKDGNLAVIHDSSLYRTAGADVVIEDLTLEELNKYRLEGTREPIPLLNEVLPLFENTGALVVELKSWKGNYAALTEATVAMLDRYKARYCIESFDPRCLVWLRKNRPEIIRGQLSTNFFKSREVLSFPTKVVLSNLMGNFLTVPDFIAYNFYYRKNLSLRICRWLYGAQEFSWTVRTPKRMKELEEDGSVVIFERFDPNSPEEE